MERTRTMKKEEIRGKEALIAVRKLVESIKWLSS